MNAYTLVDSQTRKKLDEMLKTWKEPVPGSLDTRPVFPPEVTRSIENALIKARTAALQQQYARGDVLNRGRGSTTPTGWTHTPTPPQTASRPPPVSPQNDGTHLAANGHGPGHQALVSSRTPGQASVEPVLIDVYSLSRMAAGNPRRRNPNYLQKLTSVLSIATSTVSSSRPAVNLPTIH